MKRIAMVMFIMLLVAGCAKVEKANSQKKKPDNISRFVEVEYAAMWEVVADRETGVMYAVSNGGYNHGTFTLLVDADGKPLIYKEEQDEQN